MEFVARLAGKRFIETKEAESFNDALLKLFGSHRITLDLYFNSFASRFDDNNWKETKYWREETDELYTKYLKLLEYLFKSYSGLITKPGNAPFMCLQEFRNFVIDYGLD